MTRKSERNMNHRASKDIPLDKRSPEYRRALRRAIAIANIQMTQRRTSAARRGQLEIEG